jgi:hypothetical protein
VSTCANNVAVIGFRTKTSQRKLHTLPRNCWHAAPRSARTSERLYARGGQRELRRIIGITSLARKHGAALANDACAAALDFELPSNPYRFVRLWLERKTPLTLVQVDPIIRQLTLYRDLIDQKTQEKEQE